MDSDSAQDCNFAIVFPSFDIPSLSSHPEVEANWGDLPWIQAPGGRVGQPSASG